MTRGARSYCPNTRADRSTWRTCRDGPRICLACLRSGRQLGWVEIYAGAAGGLMPFRCNLTTSAWDSSSPSRNPSCANGITVTASKRSPGEQSDTRGCLNCLPAGEKIFAAVLTSDSPAAVARLGANSIRAPGIAFGERWREEPGTDNKLKPGRYFTWRSRSPQVRFIRFG